jgi:hypothetical protein
MHFSWWHWSNILFFIKKPVAWNIPVHSSGLIPVCIGNHWFWSHSMSPLWFGSPALLLLQVHDPNLMFCWFYMFTRCRSPFVIVAALHVLCWALDYVAKFVRVILLTHPSIDNLSFIILESSFLYFVAEKVSTALWLILSFWCLVQGILGRTLSSGSDK